MVSALFGIWFQGNWGPFMFLTKTYAKIAQTIRSAISVITKNQIAFVRYSEESLFNSSFATHRTYIGFSTETKSNSASAFLRASMYQSRLEGLKRPMLSKTTIPP